MNIAKLRKEHARLAAEIHKHERTKRENQNAAMVGKCFKYRNSAGQGTGWWLYARITSGGDYWPVALVFEKAHSAEYRISQDGMFIESDGYLPITRAEFDKAWSDFRSEILALQ